MDPKDRTCSIASDATVDLETTITKTGCGKFNWLLIMLTFPVASTSVFVTGSMSYVVSIAAPDLAVSNTGKAMLQSAPYAGMIISGYLWGFLSDAFGRRRLMIIGFFLTFILNFCAGLFRVLPVILLFEFMSGFMMCGPYSIFMVYMSEVFSKHHRDMVAQFMGVFTSVGSIVQSGFGMWLIPQELPSWLPFKTWQLFIMCGGLPSLICGISSLFFYESPKFLVDKGQAEKALSVCRNIFTINTGESQLSFPVKKIHARDGDRGKKKSCCSMIMHEIFDLFKPPFLLKTLTTNLIFIIMFASQNTLRLWMPEIFTLLQNSTVTDILGLCPLIATGREDLTNNKNVTPKDSVYINMFVIHGSCLIGHLTFALIVKFLSKKLLLIVGVTAAGGCIMIVPWLKADVVVVPISIFLALYEVAIYAFLGSIIQIFPTHLRGKSVSLAMVLGRVAIFSGNFLLSNIMYTDCELMFYSLAGGNLCVVIFLFLLSFAPHDDSKISN